MVDSRSSIVLPQVKGKEPLMNACHRPSAIAHRPATVLASCLVLLASTISPASGQELEPRNLTNVPIGMNFVAAGYAYSRGNVLLDPAVPVEDLNANIHAVVAAYVRAFSFFGLSSKVDIIVPFAGADWTGTLSGVDSARAATGFGDPAVRFAVNFVGAPAMRLAEFASYRPKTIVGASVQTRIPIGQYDAARLLNLGAHRWSFRVQTGISHTIDRWIFEGHVAAWLFTRNGNFNGGQTLDQKPLFAAKLHVIRALRNGMWLAVSGGYAAGGRPTLDGVRRDFTLGTFRFAGTVVLPFARVHALKLTLASTKRIEEGPDFDNVALVYQYRWGGR